MPKTEDVLAGTAQDLLQVLEPGPENSIPLVTTGMWLDHESRDYSHFEAYEAAFDRIATQIGRATGEVAQRQTGFDDDTFEPVPLLEANDIFADFFCHWPGLKLILFYTHEDKELPIDIAIMRLR